MGTPTLKTVGIAGLVVLAVVLLAVENRIHTATHAPLPPLHGRITLAGLQHNVTVYRDAWGAPHINAKTDADAFFAFGYVSAQERMFQMDLMRRAATGRLAEILGPELLNADKLARVVGFGRIAQDSVALMGDESRTLGEAYAAGINAYLADASLPIEFGVLGYRPAPWTVVDSLAIGRLQGWSLSMNWSSELLRMAVIAERDVATADMLLPGMESWGPYILNPEQRDYAGAAPTVRAAAETVAYAPALGRAATALLAATDPALPLGPQAGFASNNWVVSGDKTRSGKPMLANDPHLSVPMPGVWMEVSIQSPTFAVTGVAFPGLPVIPLGHNRYIAWGATTTIADTQDLYIEQPHPSDPEMLYVVPGGVKRYQVVHERILVKGGGPGGGTRYVDLVVRISRHGPVINDLVEGLPADTPPIALRWAGADPSDDGTGFLKIARVRNWREFTEGLGLMVAPIQNWVFAGIDGDIGYFCGGRIPVRAAGHDPRAPVPGHTDDFEWVGFIPQDELPQVLNPPAGYVGSANNKVVPPAYPYHIQAGAAPPYRAARIQELLADASDLTVGDMARMQLDDYMIAGRRIAPHIVQAVKATGTESPSEAAALAALDAWDYHASVDSVGSTVFHAVIEKLGPAIVEDEVSPELYELTTGVFRALGGWGAIDRMLNEGYAAALWDDRSTEAIETPDVVLATAFKAAVADMAAHHGRNVARWEWGRVHHQWFLHPFSRAPKSSVTLRNAAATGMGARMANAVMDNYFSAGPFPLPGAANTLRASPSRYTDGMFDVVWGPSFRHVVDMADVSSAVSVITTGNSGHPASEYYRDQVPLWLQGKYHPMPLDLKRGDIAAKRTLLLVADRGDGA